MKFRKIIFFIFVLCAAQPLSALVGPVVPGESLWCIDKRIAGTIDIIESKVFDLERQFSILDIPLTSKLMLFSSLMDSLNQPLLHIFSSLENFQSIFDIDLSLIERAESQLPVISSKLADLFHCQSTVITSPTTISVSGVYCVSQDINGAIRIQASQVFLDLNGHRTTGTITVAAVDRVKIHDGSINASGNTAGIQVQPGASNITIDNVIVTNAVTGIAYQGVTNGDIIHCELTSNTTGIELRDTYNVVIDDSIARFNTRSGFSLVSSFTNTLRNCQALATGNGNANVINNNVYGFIAQQSSSNIFEHCIANATQALSTTDYNSIVAGFALTGTSNCNKIIGCEAANAITSARGVTVPYGIYLQQVVASSLTLTALPPIPDAGSLFGQAGWSPDGIYVVTGGAAASNGLIQVYQFNRAAQTLTRVSSLETTTAQSLQWVEWSHGGDYIAAGGSDNALSIYQFDRTNNVLTRVARIQESINFRQIRWRFDDRYIVACYAFSSAIGIKVYSFDKVTNQLASVTSVSSIGAVETVDWSPNGQFIATGSNDNFIRIYSFQNNTLAQIAADNTTSASIFSVAWSPDGSLLAVGDFSDFIRIYSFNSATPTFNQIASTPTGNLTTVGWSPDGRYLATNTLNTSVNIYSYDRGSRVLSNIASGSNIAAGFVATLHWSPDGQYIMGGTVSGAGPTLVMYRALSFPYDNVIKDNTVYCNSGAQFPSGVGISGSSICNMIIQNTAYSNPNNPSIVSSNYQFVCNVFNQLFGDAPTLMQNIALGSCEPIVQKNDVALLIKQAIAQEKTIGTYLNQLASQIPSLANRFDFQVTCTSIAITTPTTIVAAGVYCLSQNIVGPLLIQADTVMVDLNNHQVTGTITIAGRTEITVSNGMIDASGGSFGIDVQSGSRDIEISYVKVRNAVSGFNLNQTTRSTIQSCEMVNNTTGVLINRSTDIWIDESIARSNLLAGFSFVQSNTNSVTNCKAIATGENNTNVLNNNVYGFISQNGFSNIFENCIANATQALSTTDYNSIVAGFALTGTEGCSKIIDCEASNAITKSTGVTVPYGIYLQSIFNGLTSIINQSTGSAGDSVSALSWSNDDAYVAVGGTLSGNDLLIFQFNSANLTANTLTQVASVDFGSIATVFTAQWSPDNQYIAVGGDLSGNDLQIMRFERANQTISSVVSVNTGSTSDVVYAAAWSPNGNYLAVAGNLTTDDLRIYQFDRVSLALTQVVSQSTGSATDIMRAVVWTPDGNYVAVGGTASTNEVQIYAFTPLPAALTSVATIDFASDTVRALAWSPDGQFLAVGGTITGNNFLIYRRTGTMTLTLVTSVIGATSVLGISWSPDGRMVAVGGLFTGADLNIYAFDRGSGFLNLLQSVSPGGTNSDSIQAVQWSPDGRFLLVGGTITGIVTFDLTLYQALSFPSDNMIKDNTVYCNSGAQYPSGVGISGSNICNMIIQNTAYSNPNNPSMISSNYQFVCNVFNQLFGTVPSLMQNIALGSCEPVQTSAQLSLILKQTLYQESLNEILANTAQSITAVVLGLIPQSCAPIPITTNTTVQSAGSYCLANNTVTSITISAGNVIVDLAGRQITGSITITGQDSVMVRNGSIDANGGLFGISAQAGSRNITISDVLIRNAIRGVILQSVNGGAVKNCEFTQNTTGIELQQSSNITIQDSTARSNSLSGFSLVSSSTNTINNCSSLATGQGNNAVINNNVYGFISQSGFSNIFENCVANATQALSTTDYNSIVAGFALTGTESETKIIECEAANASTNASGVTIPYGIYLQNQPVNIQQVLATSSPVARYTVWSPDGQYVALNSTSHTFFIYKFDRTSFKFIRIGQTPVSGAGLYSCIAWSPDGQYFATGVVFDAGSTQTLLSLYKFDRVTETFITVFSMFIPRASASPVGITYLEWSRDGRYLGLSGKTLAQGDLQVYRFDEVNQQLIFFAAADTTGDIGDSRVTWSPDSKYIAFGQQGGTNPVRIYTFNRSTGALTLVATPSTSTSFIAAINFSSDGQFFAITGSSLGLQIFKVDSTNNVFTAVALASLSLTAGTSNSAWSPDGRYIIVGTDTTNYFYSFDRGTFSLNLLFQTTSSSIRSWSPDGQYIIGRDSTIYRVFNIPTNTVIKNNTVYCNSGAQYPSGVGISGSSIGNYIVGNVSYSNPINPSIVSTNYYFVCNVFNQLFQTVPSLLQNIALGTCEPITMPDDTSLLLKQALNQQSVVNAHFFSMLDAVNTSTICNPTPIISATTISASGYYCLATNITGSIVINASDVAIDLSNRVVTGSITVQGTDSVTIRNGRITATSTTNGIDVQSGSRNITIRDVIITNAQRGINVQSVSGGLIESCEMVNNTTGIELNQSNNIRINKSIALRNTLSGFSLVSSFTNILTECQALATGQGNTNVLNNNVYGFVSQNGFSNIFENCIANATQALSTTDYNSIVAGFALTGTENGTKIIECEAGNAQTSASGVTVPYGIYLQPQLDALLTLTAVPVIPNISVKCHIIVWSPDGVYVAVCTDDPALRIYQLNRLNMTMSQVAQVTVAGTGAISAAWSPDGQFIAQKSFGSVKQPIQVYKFDRANNLLVSFASFNTFSTDSGQCAWTPDGQYVVVTGQNTASPAGGFSIYKFDAVAGSLTFVTADGGVSGSNVNDLNVSPNGKFIVTGATFASNTNMDVWLFQNNSLSFVNSANPSPAADRASVAWSPDGNYIAQGDRPTGGFARLHVYSFNQSNYSLTLLDTVIASTSTISGVHWSSDGRKISIATSIELFVYAFDRGTNRLSPTPQAQNLIGNTDFHAWSPDGQFICAAGLSVSSLNFKVFRALSFPYDNVIKDNTVYCNSGAQYPSGVGISGSSICNMIIQNTAYSNPINPTIVSSNYQFVCNVFNQLFSNASTLMQNIALGSCDPISTPGNVAFIVSQALASLQGLGSCSPTALTINNTPSATTITASGGYCLAQDLTSDITITGTCIALDLNDHCLTGIISVQNSDDIVIHGGEIKPAAPTTAPFAAITIASTVNRAVINDVIIVCADTVKAGVAGRSGMSIAGNNTEILRCSITSGVGADGSTGGAGGDGIILTNDATQTLATKCIITTGTGGNSSGGATAGARGGHGIAVQNGAVNAEIFECLIARTGGGGSGTGAAGGNGGDGVNITSGAVDIAVRTCIIRNTGVGGSGTPAGRGGQAVHDAVTTSATASLIFKNFAFAIADATKFDIQSLGETGVVTPNPPTATIINPFANVFVS